METIELMFKSFWHFVGFIILLTGLLNFILLLWNSFLRHWTSKMNNPPAPPKSFKERLEAKQRYAGHQPTDKLDTNNPPKNKNEISK